MLTESELQLIRDEAEKYAFDNSTTEDGPFQTYRLLVEAYIAALTKERERTKELVKTLQCFIDGYDHDEDAHRHNHIPACRVCSAEKALSNYQNKTP